MGVQGLGAVLRERFARDGTHDVSLAAGEVLFRAGDVADAVYGIVSGSLLVHGDSGRELRRLDPGDLVGELGVLSGERRSATATALGPVTVWRLGFTELTQLLESDPQLTIQLTKQLAAKLRDATSDPGARTPPTIAVLHGEHAATVAEQVARLSRLPVRAVCPEGRETPRGATRRSATQALATLQSRDGRLSRRPGVDLVLCAEGRDQLAEMVAPAADWVVTGRTAPDWLPDRRRPALVAHDAASAARAARLITGCAVGLALSSGGSKAVAHIGVLQVLGERGVPIDAIAGASGGAVVGASFAFGATCGELMEQVAAIGQILTLRQLGIRALPRTSFTKGRKLPELLTELFGETRIEELAMPFAATATDAQTGAGMVLDRGLVRDAVRASMGIPGIFEPYRIDGRWLMDGALVDPLPVGAARQLGAGTVIASCVAGAGAGRSSRRDPAGAPSLTHVLATMINASEAARVETQLRLADLAIRPSVRAQHSFDFSDATGMLAAGRQAAEAALDAWDLPVSV